ncbi:MAG: PssD/Cps14F family polysaccharide biosynthesis glycosyltransferase [Anaerolineales bacterium]
MKIGLICSHGGHLTETMQLMEAFEGHKIFFATYHSMRDDVVLKEGPAYFTKNIGTSSALMLRATFWALAVIWREQPDVILSLGAEIAIPFFYLSKLLGIKTIYIESWCRVENLSLTGRLVYPVANQFWVQWPRLLDACGPKARYNGALI